MKFAVTLSRIIVGLLFIFSGLVKANDPLGLSYKMQEFFEVWGWHGLDSYTLFASVLMNAFEIIAGFALLLGWRIRLFSWLLLILIILFTFLTGYTYVTGKPTNCGCFGDCLPISSGVSFLKDVVLFLLIFFIFWQRKHIQPIFRGNATTIVMLIVTLFSFGIQWYSLQYLPIIDCLPYKKGKNIKEEMKMPPNAIPDSTVITFVYRKDGKQVEFTADKFPADFNDSYEFVSRYDKVIRKGSNNEPPIRGFVLSGFSNIDSTQIILDHPGTILIFFEHFEIPVSKWKKDFEKIYNEALKKQIPVYAITVNPVQAIRHFSGTGFAQIPILKCDFTAIRTAARTSPCLYYLENGTIINKWSWKRMTDVLEELKSR